MFTDSDPHPGRSHVEMASFAKFLEEAKVKSANNSAGVVRDILIKNACYTLISIKSVNTPWGSRQIWRLQISEDEDCPPVTIWCPKTLARYVLTDNNLDPVKVECLKSYRIVYNGCTEDAHAVVTKYNFDILI